jgi:hypothetical protein
MKLRNSFVTAGFAALALAGASVLGSAGSAQALSISFKPTGSNTMDGDPMPDLVRAVGDTINFDVYLETFGIPDDESVGSLSYLVGWDNSELTYTNHQYYTPLGSGAPLSPLTGSLLNSPLTVFQSGSPVAADSSKVKLATFSFLVKALMNDGNDGKADFLTDLLDVKDVSGTSFGGVISTQIQKVDVQTAKAVPTPALLPGLAAFGMSLVRKRKQEQAA